MNQRLWKIFYAKKIHRFTFNFKIIIFLKFQQLSNIWVKVILFGTKRSNEIVIWTRKMNKEGCRSLYFLVQGPDMDYKVGAETTQILICAFLPLFSVTCDIIHCLGETRFFSSPNVASFW